MSRLAWDATGSHLYETGVKNGVLYPIGTGTAAGSYPMGYAWNGLTAVTESPSGAEATAIYADNIKYLNLYSAEEFGATIEAYTYPDEFAECDGSASIATGATIGQQSRKTFGLCYRTELGNDTEGEGYGYKLHLIYGAKASPSERAYQTINDSPEAITFSWEVATTPINVTGFSPTSNVIIDSTKVAAGKMTELENILYGISAAEFSSTKTYVVGDYCTHAESTGGTAKTYKCTTAVTVAGEWSSSNWTEVTNPNAHLPLPDEIITILGTSAAG